MCAFILDPCAWICGSTQKHLVLHSLLFPMVTQCVTLIELLLQFCHFLINDLTYLMDEALGKLAEIKLNAPSESRNAVGEAESTLAQAERVVSSCIQLANSSLDILLFILTFCASIFLSSLILDRFVAMLQHNLALLVGKRCGELKIAHSKEKYGFDPISLVHKLTLIVLTLLPHDVFVRACGADERSFSAFLYHRVLSLLSLRLDQSNAILSFLATIDTCNAISILF